MVLDMTDTAFAPKLVHRLLWNMLHAGTGVTSGRFTPPIGDEVILSFLPALTSNDIALV